MASCGIHSAPSAWSAPDDTEVEAGAMAVGWGACWVLDLTNRSVGTELRLSRGWLGVVCFWDDDAPHRS